MSKLEQVNSCMGLGLLLTSCLTQKGIFPCTVQGQANEENLYQLERWFEYQDTIKIIRKNVEKYEQLLLEQTEKIERAKWNAVEAEQLQKEVDRLKDRK